MIETEAKEYLRDRLSDVTDRVELAQWLDELFDDELGRVLGLGLYIDVKSTALDSSLVAKVIDRMLPTAGEARDRFCRATEDTTHQTEYICKHLRGRQPLNGDRYIRILPLEAMIEFYFRFAMSLPSPSSYASQNKVLKKFFDPVRTKRRGLGVIKRTWRGRLLNVWVTSKNDLDALREKTAVDKFADMVGISLGFDGLLKGNKLVGIVYPVDPDLVAGYIPTTLDAHLNCRFFVPFADANSDWGLTCCLHNLERHLHGLKERVHEAFDGLTNEFQGEIIGDITEEFKPDWSHLLEVASGRASGL
jgi:hypothetical protein